jgi:hypothetical protein
MNRFIATAEITGVDWLFGNEKTAISSEKADFSQLVSYEPRSRSSLDLVLELQLIPVVV